MIHLHQKNKEVITFDSVYLDTTFWCQTNTHFPTRMESLELIVESIDKFMTETGNLGHIHIDRPGRIGSEYFMTELCKRYGKKIHVGSDSWQTYNGIEEVMSCLTINSEKEATFLHMCQSFGPNQRKRRLPCVPHYVNVLHIRPTAQWYSCGQEFFPKKYENDFVHISNSMHSSRAELIDFIKYLKPKKVVPCVTPKDCLKSQVTDEIDLILKEMNEGPSTRRKRGAGRWSFRKASKKASTSGFGDELDYQEN